MTATKLRAAATALLLGAAMAGAGALATSMPAYAAAVSPAVGRALQAAQSLAAAGKYKEALARVNEAGSAAKTPAEQQMVSQMKQYIGVKSGDASIGGVLGAKAKFANDYNAHKYKEVIADGELLRKSGALDGQSMLVVAQSYYLSGDKKGCINYIKRNFGNGASEDALQLQMRCAYDAGDEDSQRAALEALVARTGKPEYWTNLLKLSERAHGMSDHNTLDIYRLKLLTGTLNGKDDYTLLAQIALQLGFPAEAQGVIEKGIAAKALTADDRTKRLLALAKIQVAKDEAGQAKALAAANSAATGDALVKIGEDQIGQGNAKAAIATIQAGIAKKLKDKSNAEVRLGTAYLAAGQKDQAVRAFNSVKGDDDKDKMVMIAHLYSLYARR